MIIKFTININNGIQKNAISKLFVISFYLHFDIRQNPAIQLLTKVKVKLNLYKQKNSLVTAQEVKSN